MFMQTGLTILVLKKNPNIAEIYINPTNIKLNLEVDPKNTSAFKDYFGGKFKSDEAHGFQIFADQHLLKGKLQFKEIRKRIDRQSPLPPPGNKEPSKKVYYLEIVYPLYKLPKTIMFRAPTDKRGFISTNIGFIVYHDDVQVIDFRHLTKTATLHLNWKDPWYSSFKNKNLDRYQKFPLMSYLYIEPFEVRHEVLVRVKDLQPLFSYNFHNKKYLDSNSQKIIKSKIETLFLKHNMITIDGKKVKPILDQVNFVNFSEKGVNVIDDKKPVRLLTATVGIIISYITDGIPKQVTIHWDMFTNKIMTVPIIISDPMGPLRQNVTRTTRDISWHNFLQKYKLPRIETVQIFSKSESFKVPLLSILFLTLFVILIIIIRKRYINARSIKSLLILAALIFLSSIATYRIGNITIGHRFTNPKLSNADAKIVITNLLKNIYRAFDFRDEEAVYDKLEISLSGHLLEKIYLQQRNNMELEKLGGAKAKVKTIDLLKIKRLQNQSARGYTFRCEWTVEGSVGHWGHIHQRINKYDAILMLAPIQHSWKIVKLEPLEESRIK